MVRRAHKTAYYLNRALRVLALIRGGVPLPRSEGVWLLIADGDRPAWEVTDLLAQTHPALEPAGLSYASLLTDFDVEEFERGRRGTG
jgi:hypothetical protein